MTKIREIENEIDGLRGLGDACNDAVAELAKMEAHLRAVLGGLRDHVEAQEERIAKLETENAALRARLGGE